MIQVNVISDKEIYSNDLFNILLKTEGAKALPYLDGKKHPTIGIGFDLTDENSFDAVIDTLANSLTPEQGRILQGVINKPYTTNAAMRTAINNQMEIFHNENADIPATLGFASDNDPKIKTTLDNLVSVYEARVDKWLGTTIDNSLERIALVSLSYNGGLGPSLRDAIINGNHAEAWYEIRYQTNGTSGIDLSSRRYVEAEYFGLTKDHSANPVATKNEAHHAAIMYSAHRDTILNYENSHNPLEAARIKAEPGINDIYHEMQPAITELKTEFHIPTSFVIEETQMLEPSLIAVRTSLNGEGTSYDSSKNDQDLLIGNSANNTLDGAVGNDALVGLGGDDNIIGGDGGDIATYQGNFSDYSIEFLPDGSVKIGDKVAGRDDTDTLTGVETAKFADKSVSLEAGQDVAFVIDTTGSMFDDIDAVKAQSSKIINAIFEGENSILNSRIAVVGYNDPSTSTYLSFTDQPKIEDRKSAALAGINSISVGGGGDLPEYTYSGLLRALNGGAGSWREEAVARKIVLFGDAPAKDSHLASAVYSLARNLNVETPSAPLAFSTSSISKDISLISFEVQSINAVTGATTVVPVQVFTVAIGGYLPTVDEFQQIANATGGSAFTTTNASEIVDALLEIINLPIYTISTETSSIDEGDSGTQVVNFTISRNVSDATATVELGRSGTLDENDAGAIPFSVNFSAGETEKVFSVTVNGDRIVEEDEILSLSITAVDEPATFGASSATLTILNDDISGLNEILGTSSRDNLVGTSEADKIMSLAGSYDRMSGGKGADQFYFGTEARNSLRERDVILDYEVGIDEIVLGEDVTVGSIRQSGDSVVVFLNDDKDAIYVNGDGVTIDNITIIGAASLAGPSSSTDFWGV